MTQFTENFESAYAGNKAAAARSRKKSLEVEKLFKEWRKRSISELPERAKREV